VVGDWRHDGLGSDPQPTLFYPFAQESQGGMALVLRSALPPAILTTMVRSALSELDRDLPVGPAVTMYHHIAEMMADRRYPMMLLSLFAALAVTLAAVGIYGVLSYTVGMRTHEIGIRMALGAEPVDVLRHVVGDGLLLTLGGVLIGSLAAALAAQALGRLLYGVRSTDPLTFVAVAVLLLVVALAAMALPARRAARTDPMVALRSE
jgi:putative ABC transport system permease protein